MKNTIKLFEMIALVAIIGFAALSLTGCGGGGDPVSVTEVSISPETVTVETGKTVTLTANISPSNATNKNVTWDSINKNKATVDANGTVTGVGVGTATIIVATQDGGKIAYREVTVIPETIILPPGSLAQRLADLQTSAESGKAYTLEVNEAETLAPQTLSFTDRENITISLTATGGEKVITLSGNGRLFTIENGVTLILGSNITLKGHETNTTALVRVNADGALVMNAGAKITGNTNTSTFASGGADRYGGGVLVNSGTFEMNGGEISDNTADVGGGVYLGSGSPSFVMNGGKIIGNTADSGGGVCFISLGTPRFTMNNGEITGNTANYSGGLYALATNFIFEYNGGTVSGNTASNTASGNDYNSYFNSYFQ